MRTIRMKASKILPGIALISLLLASGAQAAARHQTARAERDETRTLNAQQLQQAEQQNAGLSINTRPVATDAAAHLSDNAPPAAAPTMPVQQASNLPQVAPAAASPPQ